MNNKTNNLVLLHGWGFNSSIWTNNLDGFKKYYSNIITLDLNGHGQTPYAAEHNNIDYYLQDLITRIPHGSSVLGWSLGGVIGLLLKHHYPNHISQIILCASSPCFISSNNWSHGVTQDNWDKFYQKLITDQKKALQEFLLLQTLSHPNSKALFKQLLAIHNNSALASLDGLNWGLNILSKDYRYILNTINPHQIKFIFGQKDLLVNTSLQSWLNDNYPVIKTYMLERSGHMPFVTEANLFNECLL